jgi:hypothetical protein
MQILRIFKPSFLAKRLLLALEKYVQRLPCFCATLAWQINRSATRHFRHLRMPCPSSVSPANSSSFHGTRWALITLKIEGINEHFSASNSALVIKAVKQLDKTWVACRYQSRSARRRDFALRYRFLWKWGNAGWRKTLRAAGTRRAWDVLSGFGESRQFPILPSDTEGQDEHLLLLKSIQCIELSLGKAMKQLDGIDVRGCISKTQISTQM